MRRRDMPGRATALAAAVLLASQPTLGSAPDLSAPWPEPGEIADIRGERITFPSHSPFSITDIGAGAEHDPPTGAVGTLFMPPDASGTDPVPGVVLLHGASGVSSTRELTYGRQFAAMGVAALVVDAFAARRDLARGFVDRLLNITETMLIADAYAALDHLAARADVEGDRVALIGFSYGGMASTYAAYEQVASRFAADGQRFAGHIAFYAPCIARFDDSTTTGAPVLMLMGSKDGITDRARCAEIAGDMDAGGSDVETIVYHGAYHQWDGNRTTPWRAPRNLDDCEFVVEPDGDVRDQFTMLAMSGPFTRRIILALCSDGEGYMLARDDEVRAMSNRDVGRFLSRIFDLEDGRPDDQARATPGG